MVDPVIVIVGDGVVDRDNDVVVEEVVLVVVVVVRPQLPAVPRHIPHPPPPQLRPVRILRDGIVVVIMEVDVVVVDVVVVDVVVVVATTTTTTTGVILFLRW